MKKQLLLLVTMLLPIIALADKSGTCGDNLTWTLDESTGTLTIEGSGTMKDYSSSIYNLAPWYYSRTKILKVVIDDGASNIGNWAFSNCSNLTTVSIPNSVSWIGERSFYRCGLTSVTVGNNVSTIGKYAFASCNKLTSVTIPNCMWFIDEEAFTDCNSLTSVHISDLLAWFGVQFGGDVSSSYASPLNSAHHLYLGDEEIKDLVIPDVVTSIGSRTFHGCRGLTSVTMHNGVTSIGYLSFSGCSGLKSVTFGNSVTTIGRSAFSGCSDLTSVTIPNSVTTIYGLAFRNCNHLTTVSIGNSVTTIGNNAFDGADLSTVISQIENPFSIDGKSSSNRVFSKNTFKNATLYVPVGTIDKYKSTDGWRDFEIIKEIEGSGGDTPPVPTSKTYELLITSTGGGSASYNGTSVRNSTQAFDVNEGISATVSFTPDDGYRIKSATMNGRIIADLSTMSFTIDIMDEDVSIAVEYEPVEVSLSDNGILFTLREDGTLEVTRLDAGITMVEILGEVTINDITYQVTSIGERAFEGRSDITYLSIPEGVTSIGNFAFYKCSGITTIEVPATVTSIGSSAFEECSSLASLIINEGLESIGGSAFEGCTNLTSISIPSTVKTILQNAFRNCKGMTDFYSKAKSVPYTDDAAFDGTPTEKSTLHVPASAVEEYRTSWPWSDFKNIVALEEDDPDGIMAVKQTNDSNNLYYDLTGRKVLYPQKGLYIKKGKKVIVK